MLFNLRVLLSIVKKWPNGIGFDFRKTVSLSIANLFLLSALLVDTIASLTLAKKKLEQDALYLKCPRNRIGILALAAPAI